jgi:hypothetical protein
MTKADLLDLFETITMCDTYISCNHNSDPEDDKSEYQFVEHILEKLTDARSITSMYIRHGETE